MVTPTSPQTTMDQDIFADPVWYQALTLLERIAYVPAINSSGLVTDQLENDRHVSRLHRWNQQPPFDEGHYWQKRLESWKITEAVLQAVLKEAPSKFQIAQIDRPDWLTTLEIIHNAAERPAYIPRSDMASEEEQVAIVLITPFSPFIAYAMQQLQAKLKEYGLNRDNAPVQLDGVCQILLNNLTEQIMSVSYRLLVLEVNIARLQGELMAATPEERFTEFLIHLSSEQNIWALLKEYPVWARQLVTIVDRWVQTSAEFLRHVCADWQDICTTFGMATDDTIESVSGGAGDTHRGGRSVMIVMFQSGTKVVYKPRSLAIDVHFQELLAWLNVRGAQPSFYITKVLAKTDHGWMEFIEHRGCAAQSEVQRFYERQGGYVALLYALQAGDFHSENLIANGEHPVLIDLEALFHQSVQQLGDISNRSAYAAIQRSVLASGLLPQRMWQSQESVGVDISGLGHEAGQTSPMSVPQWQAEGTDTMRMVRQHVDMPTSHNRPTLNGEEIHTYSYFEYVVKGFIAIYRLLMDHQNDFVENMLPRFANDEIRIVVRPTQRYSMLLFESTHPQLLRNALDRDLLFDHLWTVVKTQPVLLSLISFEQADLHNGDVPMFTTYVDSQHLYSSHGERIPGMFRESSLEMTKRKVRELSDADLERQLWFIQTSTLSGLVPSSEMMRHQAGTTSHNGKQAVASSLREQPDIIVSREKLLSSAQSVGDRLLHLAISEEQGLSWLGLTVMNDHNWMVLPCGPDLYDGLAGIGLFLAYLGSFTQDERYTMVAHEVVMTLQHQISNDNIGAYHPIGGFNGIGGLIYCLTQVGTLWNDSTLLETATSLVEVSQQRITSDTTFDIIGGAGGYILALLSLHHVAPSHLALAAAIDAGDHLLRHAKTTPSGIGWLSNTDDQMPLTGFSHGSAGIALSLLKLAHLTGQSQFREVALQGIAYERRMFSEEKQNWYDLRSFGDHVSAEVYTSGCMSAWCHGAPGVGMGRLESLPYMPDDNDIHQEIAAAIHTTLNHGFGLNHSLCHGSLGNLELLLSAAQTLPEPQYYEYIDQITPEILTNIEQNGWRTGLPLELESPGLMVGLAGIGYQLLRLAEPEKVPSVLVLEPPR